MPSRFIPRIRASILARLAAGALMVMLAACGTAPPTVLIDGSSTVFPVTEAVAEEFQLTGERVRISVGVSGTGGGMSKFCAGETDVTNASRVIKAEELEACAASGVEPLELAVAIDAIAVITQPQTDWLAGDCISVEHLHTAWRAGSDVMRWSDLDPAWPDVEIKFYSPGHDSGTFDYFTEVINGRVGDSRTRGVLFSEDDNVLVQGIGGDRGSLGYFGLAYYDENRERLKLLSVDSGQGCVAPDHEAIAQDRYQPLARPIYLYVSRQSLERDEVRSFMRFYLQTVNRILPEVGMLPLPEDQALAEVEELEAAITGAGRDS